MLINEVCRECNLTKKAIEYYGEQGLISPVIMDNGYRQFSDADVSKLKRIAVLRGLGFSVSDIRTVLEKEGLPAIYDVLNKKELEIADLQTKRALIKQLADGGDWDHIRTQIISFLDGIIVTVSGDLQEYLDEAIRNTDIAIIQNASAALSAAMENPEQYIHDNKDMLEQYRAVMESEEYKATPAYRLQECLKQFQNESGYNEVFIPAMQRLSPSYREYYKALQIANETFIRQYPQH